MVWQSYESWKIIFVDDGSTDSTGDLIRRWQRALGSQVSVLAGENRGASSARNWAISEVQTEFVALLDADDVWHRDKLRIQMEFLSSDSGLVGVTTAYSLADSSLKKRTRTLNFDWSNRDMLNWTLLGTRTPAMNSTLLVRRAVLEICGFFDVDMVSHSEDLDLAWRLIEVGAVGSVKENLATIRMSPGQTHRDFEKMVAASQILYQKLEIMQPGLAKTASANLTLYSLIRRLMATRKPRAVAGFVWGVLCHPIVAIKYLGRRARDWGRLQIR